MNTAQTNKTSNINHIATGLNYFYYTNKHIKRLRKQTSITRLLIILLVVWNIVLTLQLTTPNNIPQFTDKQNELITELEEIPMYELD